MINICLILASDKNTNELCKCLLFSDKYDFPAQKNPLRYLAKVSFLPDFNLYMV